MRRHWNPRVKSEYVLLPEAKPRAIVLMRSWPEGYRGVTEGNIFTIGHLLHALFILLHGQPHHLYVQKMCFIPTTCMFYNIKTSSVWFSAQIFVHEQPTIAHCHGVKDEGLVLLISRSPVNSQKYHMPGLHRSHVIKPKWWQNVMLWRFDVAPLHSILFKFILFPHSGSIVRRDVAWHMAQRMDKNLGWNSHALTLQKNTNAAFLLVNRKK